MKCSKCKKKFEPSLEPGALIFSSPLIDEDLDEYGICVKYHICQSCERLLMNWMRRKVYDK